MKQKISVLFLCAILLLSSGCQKPQNTMPTSSAGVPVTTSSASVVPSAVKKKKTAVTKSTTKKTAKKSTTATVKKHTAAAKKTTVLNKKPVTVKKTAAVQKTVKKKAAVQKTITPVCSASYVGQIEQEIFSMVNAERKSKGLSTLKWNNTLYKSAKIRSDEMADTGVYSHTRPDNTLWNTAILSAGYKYISIRENIVRAQNAALVYGDDVDTVAKLLYKAWKDSPAHYEGIIDPDMKETGICIVYSGDDIYGTEHFGDPA